MHAVAIALLRDELEHTYPAKALRDRIAIIRERQRARAWSESIIRVYAEGVLRTWRERCALRKSIAALEYLDHLDMVAREAAERSERR